MWDSYPKLSSIATGGFLLLSNRKISNDIIFTRAHRHTDNSFNKSPFDVSPNMMPSNDGYPCARGFLKNLFQPVKKLDPTHSCALVHNINAYKFTE